MTIFAEAVSAVETITDNLGIINMGAEFLKSDETMDAHVPYRTILLEFTNSHNDIFGIYIPCYLDDVDYMQNMLLAQIELYPRKLTHLNKMHLFQV